MRRGRLFVCQCDISGISKDLLQLLAPSRSHSMAAMEAAGLTKGKHDVGCTVEALRKSRSTCCGVTTARFDNADIDHGDQHCTHDTNKR